jgi:hypothetical protein
MATDNKGVMVYLSPDLEIAVAKYCTVNKITRKNKDGTAMPSMGTGIMQYLKSHLLSTEERNKSDTGLTRDDVQLMIDEAIELLRSDILEDAANEPVISRVPNDILARLEALESAAGNANSQQPDKPRKVLHNLTAPTKGIYRVDR